MRAAAGHATNGPVTPGTGEIEGAEAADAFARDWRDLRADSDIQVAPLEPPKAPETPGWLQALGDFLGDLFSPVGDALSGLGRLLGMSGQALMWLLIGIAAFGVAGHALYWYYLPHYTAAYTLVLVLLITLAMRAMARWRHRGRAVGGYALIAVFASALAPNVAGVGRLLLEGGVTKTKNRPYVEAQLKKISGKHLVFVHYGPNHGVHGEWVYNAANIDSAPVVWAREWRPDRDEALMQYFAARYVWRVDADQPDGRPFLIAVRGPLSARRPPDSIIEGDSYSERQPADQGVARPSAPAGP